MKREREAAAESRGFPMVWTGLLCLSAAYVVLGVLLLAVPQISLVTICGVLGVALVVAGAVSALAYFLRRQYETPGHFGFAVGAACVLLGVFALLRTGQVAFAFSQILAVCVVGDSLVKLQYATDLLRLRRRYWFVVLAGALALAALALVALADPFGQDSVRLPFTYAVMIADGAANAAAVLYLRSAYRGQRLLEEDAGEDADADACGRDEPD